MIWRPLQASKATAQKIYVRGKGNPDKSTNIFSEELFKVLLTKDDSLQKKYVQAFCKWIFEYVIKSMRGREIPSGAVLEVGSGLSLYQNIILFPDPGPKHERNSELMNFHFPLGMIKDCLDLLEKARSRNIPLKDVNSFKTFEDFQKYAEGLDKKYLLSQGRKNEAWVDHVRKTFSQPNNSDDFIKVETGSACVIPMESYGQLWSLVDDLVGEDTHWCVGRKGSYWFDYAVDERACFYLIISFIPKSDNDRLYLLEKREGSNKKFWVWHWDNEILNPSHSQMILNSLGINPDDFPYFKSDPGNPDEDYDEEYEDEDDEDEDDD